MNKFEEGNEYAESSNIKKVDLHVHSKYSNHPSEWFLKRIGASESYTEPISIYELAMERGMDFVTVTDHNRVDASQELHIKYPHNTFTGVESTTYFPEDGCKVHILIYGLNTRQFAMIQKKRKNIYELRNYLMEEDLAYSVAHATFSINKKLTISHLEKLILLFNIFEGINGSRNSMHNRTWMEVLQSLTSPIMDQLEKKHNIVPWGKSPCLKGITGGSDDHAGIFIGKSYTTAIALTPEEFLIQLKNRNTECGGKVNDFRAFTFALYKIAYDFSHNKSTEFAKSSISDISSFLFTKKKFSLRDRIKLSKMKKKKNKIYHSIAKLIETTSAIEAKEIDTKLDILYETVTEISDQFFKNLFKELSSDVKKVNIIKVVQGLSSSIPGIFLTIPFLSAFQFMFNDRELIKQLKNKFLPNTIKDQKRILWFTDTLTDLNGVSMTLKTIGRIAEEKGFDICMIACLKNNQITSDIPYSTIIVPAIHGFELPHYEHQRVNIPSILYALKAVFEYEPDELYISTPGPMGALGLLLSKLLNVKASGIYHTDFTIESIAITKELALAEIVEKYTKWFFSNMDRILVPTEEYINILSERGFDFGSMELFKRGIETSFFNPKLLEERQDQIIRLLYVGRISKDKNIDFLIEVFDLIQSSTKNVMLNIVGDGPYLLDLVRKHGTKPQLFFLGKKEYADLPELYSRHDLILFPSISDTFGMVVLEAQACGLPAIVSNIGGPKEIINEGNTGFSLPVTNPNIWVEKVNLLIPHILNNDASYMEMRVNSRKRVMEYYDWNSILHLMVSPDKLASETHDIIEESVKNI